MSDEIQIIVEEADPVLVIVQETLIREFGNSTEVVGEEITGGTSSTITLAHTPAAGKLKLFKNGIRLPNSEYTYTGSSADVTLTSSREATDIFTADYKY
jgi:hypothetical protein